VSSDSDRFDFVGDGAEFIQKLALDQPASTDLNYVFTQFTVACGTRPAPAPGESELVQKLQAGMTANSQAAAEREAELQAEIDKRDCKAREDSQELSDLRGELNAQGSRAAEVQTLSRRVASLEGELDQANRRAAAAERKTLAAPVRRRWLPDARVCP